MIENKKRFRIGIISHIILIILMLQFPHDVPLLKTIFEALNIPIYSGDGEGFNYVGITLLVIWLVSIFFVGTSLKKYRNRTILFMFFISPMIPVMIVDFYQHTFAKGIYAVDYDHNVSFCEFELIDDSILNGECHLVMENFSKDEVQFTVEFYDRYDKEMFELMNEYGPYTVTLQGNSEKTVWIETKMDVSNLEEVIAHGSASGFNIIIKSGEKSRYLGG